MSEEGLTFPQTLTEPVNVLFDEDRVWSFNPARDAVSRRGVHIVPWPEALKPFLSGRTEVSLRNHVSGETYFREPVTFGGSTEPVRVVDANGYQLAVDKGGRMQRTFSRTDDSMREFIMDAVEKVLHDLREVCGLEAFLSYGCLLGAVRDGHMIGHDSDADLSYISRFTHPFDIVREANDAERTMKQLGWRTVRMSGADFKVWVDLGDGRRCGIDVFGSFYIDGVYYLTASRSGRLDRSAILPLGTVTLEGREILAPRDVDSYLEYIYGPSWRVPDPAFKFSKDHTTVRRMSGWLRGPRENLRHWHTFYKSGAADQVPSEPSLFVQWVQQWIKENLGTEQRIFDAGSGTGRDALWLAEQGHHLVAADFSLVVFSKVQRQAARRNLDVATQHVNFNNIGSVLLAGAKLAHEEVPHHIYARFLLDALSTDSRALFWRFAQMSQRHGGLTFLEFRTHHNSQKHTHFPRHYRAFLDPDRVAHEIAEHGGRIVERHVGRGLAPLGSEDPEVCRMIVRWQS